jgi:hypothetical protein
MRTAELMATREAAARIAGELAALQARPWGRRLAISDDRCPLWPKTVHSRPVHAEGAGDLHHSLARVDPLDGPSPLMRCQLLRPLEAHTSRP